MTSTTAPARNGYRRAFCALGALRPGRGEPDAVAVAGALMSTLPRRGHRVLHAPNRIHVTPRRDSPSIGAPVRVAHLSELAPKPAADSSCRLWVEDRRMPRISARPAGQRIWVSHLVFGARLRIPGTVVRRRPPAGHGAPRRPLVPAPPPCGVACRRRRSAPPRPRIPHKWRRRRRNRLADRRST